MRTQPHDTARPHTATTAYPDLNPAPCPSCGGTGRHPSNDHSAQCIPCEGTGVVQSAGDAHALAALYANTIVGLLDLAVTAETDAREPLLYAAEHLTVQAVAAVAASPHPTPEDAPPADRLISQSMTHARGELPALHAVLYGMDCETDGYATMGAAMIARAIADRIQRAEDEAAMLCADAARSGNGLPE